jgi:hypothetical protein
MPAVPTPRPAFCFLSALEAETKRAHAHPHSWKKHPMLTRNAEDARRKAQVFPGTEKHKKSAEKTGRIGADGHEDERTMRATRASANYR